MTAHEHEDRDDSEPASKDCQTHDCILHHAHGGPCRVDRPIVLSALAVYAYAIRAGLEREDTTDE